MRTSRLVTKIDSEDPTIQLAVLIDADNAQAAIIENLLAEIARFGEAIVKRIYGDFTSTKSAAWRRVLQRYAIKPMQQYAYTVGKNATDSALIIDAMDLLYSGRFGGFCLVTSDSDFTGLAVRLREEGLKVYGFGEKKTPEAFRNACNKFIFTELLRGEERSEPPPSPAKAGAEGKVASGRKSSRAAALPAAGGRAAETPAAEVAPPFPTAFLLKALEQSSEENGWAQLGTFANYLNKLKPDFDSRLYGFKKLSDLVKKKSDLFETREENIAGTNNKVRYLRAVPGK